MALLALGLFLFQLSLTPPATDYLGFTGLRWQESDGCREGGAYTELQPSLGSVGSWISGGGEHTGSCKSELVEALGPIVEFEYGGYPSSEQDKLAEILLWRSDRTLPQSLHLDYPHLAHLGETWRRARVELDQFSPGVKIGFELRDQAEVAHGGWLAQRSRVSFFGSSESAGYWYCLLYTSPSPRD